MCDESRGAWSGARWGPHRCINSPGASLVWVHNWRRRRRREGMGSHLGGCHRRQPVEGCGLLPGHHRSVQLYLRACTAPGADAGIHQKALKPVTQECVAFVSCVARIERANPSGTNKDDRVRLETGLYNGKMFMTVQKDCGPEFKFFAAWMELKDHPKLLIESKPDPQAPTSS